MEYNGFNIVHDGTYGYKSISTVGSGSLPKSLKGRFTTGVEAQKAIDSYVATKGSKTSAKKADTGRG